MFKQLVTVRKQLNFHSIKNLQNYYYGIKSFSTNCVIKSFSEQANNNNDEVNNNINLKIEENNSEQFNDVNNNNNSTRTIGEKQNRNMSKLFRKRDQTLETAKKFKDLNRKFTPSNVEEPKKKKASPDLKKAIKLLKFMDVMEKASQGIDFDQEQEFSKYDNDDDPRMPEKKSKVAKTRRTMDIHLDERNFNLQKPVPKTILKGQLKEIKRARKIIDDDEKHLKDKKPFKF